MSPVQTLHDFTLGLLRDPQALSVFQADPERVLGAAGLGDVTAADVHEVLPLVMDQAPAPVVEKFDQLGGAERLDPLANVFVPNGSAGAIEQLHQIADRFAFPEAGPATGTDALFGPDTVASTLAGQVGRAPAAGSLTDHHVNVPAVGGVANAVTSQAAHPADVLAKAAHVAGQPMNDSHAAQLLPAGPGVAPDVTSPVHNNLLASEDMHRMAEDAHHNIGGDPLGIGHGVEPHALDLPGAHEFHPGL